MLERARAEADSIVSKAEADAAALVERRTRMAEDKIAAAERAALDEVRTRAASAAAAAAEALIRDRLDDQAGKAMVDATIAELGRRLGYGFGARFARAQASTRSSHSSDTSARLTIVAPPRPQAPAAGLNATGSASIASSCCSGSSITAPVPFSGACSVAKIFPPTRKSG